MDLTPFTKAGLKHKEIGTIVGVSHTTAGYWMRGKREVHFLLEDRVRPVIEAVTKALENEELPLPSTVPRDKRMDKIQSIVKHYS